MEDYNFFMCSQTFHFEVNDRGDVASSERVELSKGFKVMV